MTSPIPGNSGDRRGCRDGLDAVFTGRHFQPQAQGAEGRASSASSGQDEHADIAAFDVQAAEAPHSNKKFPFFIREGQRYHISTSVADTEIYHEFTLDQWEKIADKMDALKGHEDGIGNAQLREFAVNLSTESFIGIARDNPSSYESAAFTPTHQAYKSFETLRNHVQDLLPTPISSIGFHDAYPSHKSSRSVFPTVTEKSKEKTNKQDLEAFYTEHESGAVTHILHLKSYGINDQSADDCVNAFTLQQEAKLTDLEQALTQHSVGSDGKSVSLEAHLQEELTAAENDLKTALEQTPQDTRDVATKKSAVKDLESRLQACSYKEQLRLATLLHNSHLYTQGAFDPTAAPADYMRTDYENTQAVLQNAFDARLVLCHKEGLIDAEGKVSTNMTKEELAKYQEITDTAALLIPNLDPSQTGQRSQSDHMMQLFYGGGSALNALAQRPTTPSDGNNSSIYTTFPSVAPPKGRSADVHTAMRKLLQQTL